MNKGCQLKAECRFYQKFHSRSSTTWKGLVHMYCQGHGAQLCERKPFIERGEEKRITDDLMPTGNKVPHAFQLLP